jgi:ribosome-associated protein
MSDDIVINKHTTIPGWEIWRTTSTSGGPGGQHANRAETKVTLHWVPEDTSAVDGKQKRRLVQRLQKRLTNAGELQVSSQETRSQKRNLEDARDRFASIVRKALKRRKRRKRMRRSRASDERRLKNKKHRGRIKRLRKSPSIPDY